MLVWGYSLIGHDRVVSTMVIGVGDGGVSKFMATGRL